jgi:BirA family biotin operon repressor/biotin-[acetyl-CoA-carboxylase] ligase
MEAVLGLGLNVNLRRANLPEEIQATATTLREVTGREQRLEAIAARTLEGLEQLWPAVSGEGGRLHEEWRRWDALWEAEVIVEDGAGAWCGEARGIDGRGALVVAVGGEVRRLSAAEVSRVRAA